MKISRNDRYQIAVALAVVCLALCATGFTIASVSIDDKRMADAFLAMLMLVSITAPVLLYSVEPQDRVPFTVLKSFLKKWLLPTGAAWFLVNAVYVSVNYLDQFGRYSVRQWALTSVFLLLSMMTVLWWRRDGQTEAPEHLNHKQVKQQYGEGM